MNTFIRILLWAIFLGMFVLACSFIGGFFFSYMDNKAIHTYKFYFVECLKIISLVIVIILLMVNCLKNGKGFK